MMIMIETRQVVFDAYASSFSKYGVALQGFLPNDFTDWVNMASTDELGAIEAYLIGDNPDLETLIKAINIHGRQPVLALVDSVRVDDVVRLYELGVDDVVRKPVHLREVICRINAIHGRAAARVDDDINTEFHIFFDNRNPYVGGSVLELPRRERRLLEFLASKPGRRATKEQIFNAIYGIFEDNVSECVVESHISKLRKKLKHRLGYDPIDCKRYLGYCFQLEEFEPRSVRVPEPLEMLA